MVQPSGLEAISLLSYRVEALEKHINQLDTQIAGLVPQRENDLRIQSIKEIVSDVKSDVIMMKSQDLVAINKHIGDVERQIYTQGEEQRESMDKIQIRALTVITSSILTIVSALIINYFVHFWK